MVTVVLDVLPRVAVVPTLLLVQQQQIERVQVADRDNIKIPIHMPVHLVNVAKNHVVLELENRQLVLQKLIEYVHKIHVHVPMALTQLEPLVLQTMPTFVRLVPLDSTKLVTIVQHALHVVLKPIKLPLVHPVQIVNVQPVLLALLENVKLQLVPLHQIVNVPIVRLPNFNRLIHSMELRVHHGQNARQEKKEQHQHDPLIVFVLHVHQIHFKLLLYLKVLLVLIGKLVVLERMSVRPEPLS